jgi:hypothetical protein
MPLLCLASAITMGYRATLRDWAATPREVGWLDANDYGMT